jgi:cystathionine gamma-synthase
VTERGGAALHLSSTYAFRASATSASTTTAARATTRDLLAVALADLEAGAGAVICGLGMGAITLVGHLLPVGRAASSRRHDCYGGTFRLAHGVEQSG